MVVLHGTDRALSPQSSARHLGIGCSYLCPMEQFDATVLVSGNSKKKIDVFGSMSLRGDDEHHYQAVELFRA
jgi:hypothetical protein